MYIPKGSIFIKLTSKCVDWYSENWINVCWTKKSVIWISNLDFIPSIVLKTVLALVCSDYKDPLMTGKLLLQGQSCPLSRQNHGRPAPACSAWPAGNAHHEDPQGHPAICAAKLSFSVRQFQKLLGKTKPLEPVHGRKKMINQGHCLLKKMIH